MAKSLRNVSEAISCSSQSGHAPDEDIFREGSSWTVSDLLGSVFGARNLKLVEVATEHYKESNV